MAATGSAKFGTDTLVIDEIDFNDQAPDTLRMMKYGSNWPVVYILSSESEAYIGETLDATTRASQHLQNNNRRRLTRICLISNGDFNKSVILDLEAYLINHMQADRLFLLQNGNNGLHAHAYYNKAYYESQFRTLWERLKSFHLVQHDLKSVENSDAFKYSPYTALSIDQYNALDGIVADLGNAMSNNQRRTSVVYGGPGTGKTVMAVDLLRMLVTLESTVSDEEQEKTEDVFSSLTDHLLKLDTHLRVGLVVPQQSLRQTLQHVFKSSKNPVLTEDMVISPQDVAKAKRYNVLIVDEAHRLKRRHGLSHYPSFDKANALLGLDENGTELDWICKKSDYQILFYDPQQSVKPSDIQPEQFTNIIGEERTSCFYLHTQFRCRGGEAYIEYIRQVFSDHPPEMIPAFDGYDLRIFKDCGEMTDRIRQLNAEYQLCRTVAGYGWKWVSKKDQAEYDIHLDGRQYRWNTTDRDWINSPTSIDEIGCIHTVQGYDLNYCAVVIGPELDYDPEKKRFVVHKDKYYDSLGKSVGKDKKALCDYILNVYKTLCSRGMLGTYIYVCNENLRDYLRKYIAAEFT